MFGSTYRGLQFSFDRSLEHLSLGNLCQLEQVRSSPDVTEPTPIYFGMAKWKSGEGNLWPDIFMIGIDPASQIFIPNTINQQTAVLDRIDIAEERDAGELASELFAQGFTEPVIASCGLQVVVEKPCGQQ